MLLPIADAGQMTATAVGTDPPQSELDPARKRFPTQIFFEVA